MYIYICTQLLLLSIIPREFSKIGHIIPDPPTQGMSRPSSQRSGNCKRTVREEIWGWQNHRKTMGKPCENHWKPWENHRKTMGQRCRKYYSHLLACFFHVFPGKTMGKPMKTMCNAWSMNVNESMHQSVAFIVSMHPWRCPDFRFQPQLLCLSEPCLIWMQHQLNVIKAHDVHWYTI